MEAAPELRGQILNGRYRIERLLGAGGMGAVYQATQLPCGRSCALKIILPHILALGNSAVLRRFQREVRLGLRVLHEGLVTIYDYDTLSDGSMYYTMELLSGKSLSQVLGQVRTLPWQDVAEIGLQAAQCLHSVHLAGIFHRDLKPGNLQILRDGRLKILDFGVAHGGAMELAPEDLTDIQTGAGDILGTPAYMAPEQLLDSSQVDPRSDVYSLALVLYEAMTAHQPFADLSLPAVLQRKFYPKSIPPLRQLCPKAPVAFESLLQSALRDIDDRTADMLSLIDELEALVPRNRQRNRQRLAERIQKVLLTPTQPWDLPTVKTASGNEDKAERPEPSRLPPKKKAPFERRLLWPVALGVAVSLGGLGVFALDAAKPRSAPPKEESKPESPKAPKKEEPVEFAEASKRGARPPPTALSRERRRKPPAVDEGKVRISIRPYAEIYINGVHRPEATPYTYTLPAGRYQVRAVNPALGRDETRVLQVPPAGQVEFSLDWTAP